MSNPEIENSKFMSYVLRHEPQAIGLTLDEEGWADIAEFIAKANAAGKQFNEELIREIVKNSDKKRFAISEDGLKIRAVQGHSTSLVHIHYEPKQPPQFLFHGTATRFLSSIQNQGLLAGDRQYVHLSKDCETAVSVGKRHGKPVVLKIKAGEMHEQGYSFFQAENGVWLTEKVPPQFILFER
jgi:putative RNA 2'-phosphotransferase